MFTPRAQQIAGVLICCFVDVLQWQTTQAHVYLKCAERELGWKIDSITEPYFLDDIKLRERTVPSALERDRRCGTQSRSSPARGRTGTD